MILLVPQNVIRREYIAGGGLIKVKLQFLEDATAHLKFKVYVQWIICHAEFSNQALGLTGVGARDAKRHLNLKSTSGLRDQTSARDAERHLNAPLF